MPAFGQLSGQVLVRRDVIRQEREAVERRVASGVEDHDRREQHQVVDDVADAVAAEDVQHLLADDGRRAGGVGDRVGPGREQRDAEQEEGQDARHRDEGLSRVGRLGATEARDAVRDRLEAGQRRAAVGVGAQERDEREPHQDAGPLGAEVVVDEVLLHRQRDAIERSRDLLRHAEDDGGRHHQDVEVRREGEVAAGLLQPPQVAVDEDEDDAHRDQERVGRVAQPRERAGERGGAGRALHGDRHRVVDQQCDGRDLGDLRAEVVAGHHVRAAGRRVVLDDVHVAGGDEEEHAQDDEHDRHDEGERGEADVRRHLREDLLGAVRRGRDAVGRQDAECDPPVESLAAELFGHERLAEQDPLDPVAQGLGIHVGQVGVGRQNERTFGNLLIGF